MLIRKTYKTYYGKRHWSIYPIPFISLNASTDWSGDGEFRFGTGKPCDVQVVVIGFCWLVWQKSIKFRWKI